MRFKRHRWHPKILKNRDPLIFSIGWRRFQSIPVYSIVDQNSRNRMLKYTPEHMHCMATIYGPVTPINTGVIAFQSHSSSKASFRVSGTGTITELDESFRIVKKLKLTGYPVEVHRNTAFIRDMFSSSLEASKFEGATIRTVSGIRGQIKKALTAPGTEGRVRCTFEDKILRSDIVFCRTWTTVELVKFYNPVTSLLLTEKENWQGMRGVTQLRREKNVPVPHKKDSEYRAINRPAKLFNPLIVPSKLQAELPFSSKSKDAPKRRRPLLEERRKVALSSSERKAVSVLNQVHLLRNEKLEKRKLAEKEKRIQRQKELDKAEKESAAARRSKRKEAFAKEARMGKKPRNST